MDPNTTLQRWLDCDDDRLRGPPSSCGYAVHGPRTSGRPSVPYRRRTDGRAVAHAHRHRRAPPGSQLAPARGGVVPSGRHSAVNYDSRCVLVYIDAPRYAVFDARPGPALPGRPVPHSRIRPGLAVGRYNWGLPHAHQRPNFIKLSRTTVCRRCSLLPQRTHDFCAENSAASSARPVSLPS